MKPTHPKPLVHRQLLSCGLTSFQHLWHRRLAGGPTGGTPVPQNREQGGLTRKTTSDGVLVTLQKRALVFVGAMLICALTTNAASAADRPRGGAEFVQQGNRLLAEEKFAEALEAYNQALDALPDSAEVAYNRGIALYRLGRIADAETAFQNALSPNQPELEATAKYNLGRCAHATAMRKTGDLENAINDLKQAINFYNDALQLRPQDPDARHNLALAERLQGYLKKKLEQLRKQQQQQEQEQGDQKQEGDQENESDQQGDDPQEGEGKQKEDGRDEQNAQQPEPSTQPSDEREPTSQPSTRPAEAQEPASQPTSEPSEQAKPPPEKDPTSRPTKPQESEEDARKRISREDALRMLQEAHDAEQKRRELQRLRKLHRQGRTTPEKDW